MNSVDIARRSLRNLNQARLRTFLTACAIGIGAFALAITLSLGTSLNALAEKLLFSGQDRSAITVTAKASDPGPNFNSDEPKEYEETAPGVDPITFMSLLNQDHIAEIETIEGVEKVERPYEFGVQAEFIRVGDAQFEVSARGPQEPRPSIAAGGFEGLGEDGVIITEHYVKALGFFDDADVLDKKVSIGFTNAQGELVEREYTVKGVAVKPSGLLAFFGSDAAYFSAPEIQHLYDMSTQGTKEHGSFFMVTAQASKDATPEELEQIRDRINAAQGGEVFDAKTRADSAQEQGQFVRVVQYALAGFAAVVLLASLFGIVNTQLMSVFQRTREIGLMKALGMRSGAVSRLFLLEAMFIGLFGALLGIAGAYVTARLVDPWIVQQLEMLGVSGRFLIFDPIQLILLCLGLMVVAALAGVAPARKAAKLDPIEALRVE